MLLMTFEELPREVPSVSPFLCIFTVTIIIGDPDESQSWGLTQPPPHLPPPGALSCIPAAVLTVDPVNALALGQLASHQAVRVIGRMAASLA